MALLPVTTNRVSTPLNNQRLLFQLNNDQLAIQKYYDQLSTGRRVLRLSDDPSAGARAISLQRGVEQTAQLVRNASATEAYHQSTDVALSRVTSGLIQARGVAVEAAQNVISQDEREALAMTIRQTLESVVAAGNAMFTDHQLLGGILEPHAALEQDGQTVRFRGTDAVGRTNVGAGGPTSLTVSGHDAIGVASTFLEGQPLNAAMHADSRLVDLRQGVGVKPGVISLSDGDQSIQLDMRHASTIGDVAEILRTTTLGDRALSVTLGDDSISLQYADGLPGTLAVADEPGSQLAADLQISNPGGFNPPPLIGDRLSPRVTLGTSLAELNSGAGLDLTGGLVIDQGNERITVTFEDAETIGDVIIAINRSGADVRAELNQEQGRLRLRAIASGVDYSIGENGGSAAEQLGIRTANEDVLLSDLARGRGLNLHAEGPDVVITRPDGVALALELEDARTIEDVITIIRDHPDNQDPNRVEVALNDVGNGLQLSAPLGGQPITITQPGTSDAGVQLGWITPGESEAVGVSEGGLARLVGEDFHPRDAGGAIDTLLRLERAVREGDIPEIGRLQVRLDADLDQSSRTRGRVGLWNATVRDLKEATQDENVQLQAQLADAVEVDIASVISRLTARQTALEASMRFIGQTAGLSVLNYL